MTLSDVCSGCGVSGAGCVYAIIHPDRAPERLPRVPWPYQAYRSGWMLRFFPLGDGTDRFLLEVEIARKPGWRLRLLAWLTGGGVIWREDLL